MVERGVWVKEGRRPTGGAKHKGRKAELRRTLATETFFKENCDRTMTD